MPWTPPYGRTAAITVSTWISGDTSVEVQVEDVALDDTEAVVEHLAAQLTAAAARLRPKRRVHRKKKTDAELSQ